MGPGCPIGAGVLVPPVGRGVLKAEGISEVKMVADGERMYFWVMTPRRAWAKPIHVQTVSQTPSQVEGKSSRTINHH
jgi:hypothetical protein